MHPACETNGLSMKIGLKIGMDGVLAYICGTQLFEYDLR